LRTLEENLGKTFQNIGTDNGFLNRNKSKNGQMGLYPIKKLLHIKETITREKRQPTERKKTSEKA
jgi:hypothetical protein